MQEVLAQDSSPEESCDIETGTKSQRIKCDCGSGLLGRLWHWLRRHPQKATNDWSMTHSFPTIMGGFAIEVTENGKPILDGHHKRLVLDEVSLKWFFRSKAGSIPTLSKSDIEDKSKSDGLAKSIVVIQALWFCAQCVVRLAQNLSISLLELNTLGHAICAFLVFAVWWEKPQDIVEPFLLSGPDIREVGAALYLCRRDTVFRAWTQSIYGVPSQIYAKLGREEDVRHYLNCHNPLGSEGRPPTTISGIPGNYLGETPQLLPSHKVLQTQAQAHSVYSKNRKLSSFAEEYQTENPFVGRLYAGQKIFRFSFACPLVQPRAFSWRKPPIFRSNERRRYLSMRRGILSLGRPYIDLKASDVRVLQLASQAMGNYNIRSESGVHWRLANFLDLASFLDSHVVPLLFGCAGLCYGGLHLLAWNAPFPTLAAKYMWRISGTYIAAIGILTYFVTSCFQIRRTSIGNFVNKRGTFDATLRKLDSLKIKLRELSEWANRTRLSDSLNLSLAQLVERVLDVVCFPIVLTLLALFLLYPAARVYLVVECFINLTHLPESAYLEPEWSRYFPHIF